MTTDAMTAATAATPVPEPLPPYSGDDTLCAMCSYDLAYTSFRAKQARVQREFNGRIERHAVFPARLERQCKRCDYQWDEALNPPPGPEPARPATLADLVDAIGISCQGYAVDLHPQLAEHMAGILLDLLLIDIRTDHPAWTKTARPRPLLAPPAAPADPDPALTSPVPIATPDQEQPPIARPPRGRLRRPHPAPPEDRGRRVIKPSFSRVDALRITPAGDAEPLLLNPCPVDLGLAPILSTDQDTLVRYDLTLSVAVAPGHVDEGALSESLAPVLGPLREALAPGGPVQIETWTAIAGTELPWWKTAVPQVDQVDTGILDVEQVEPDGSDPYARVTFLRATVNPDGDRNFYRMQMGTEDLAPPRNAPALGVTRTGS